ncbi:uncharacterized protein LOC142094598 [Mixophyes fleayi]|uniref:uncharacterized protein LOC142094598 n=1 Tax=Mixophyes fleayi TaxID=3061075 RepID=UPI003F4D9F2D
MELIRHVELEGASGEIGVRSTVERRNRKSCDVSGSVCKKTSRWASLVDFPTSFTYIKENEDVEVSCQNQFESRTFQLKCRQEYDEFQLYQDRLQIPCIVFVTEKCRRLTSWRENVTIYPEQDYYDPEEEVTLTCSPGYEPNYSKIKCMRGNNTNIWNVTEDFCRQKIHPPTTPPDIKELIESSWRKVLVSWTFGLMPPMAIKLMAILTIFTVRIFYIIRRRYKSTQEAAVKTERKFQQEMTNLYHKTTGDNTLLSHTEEDQQIYENLQTHITVYCSTH